MDFGFARYDLNEITRRIELPEVSPDPKHPLTLIVRCAVTGNRNFANSLFKYVQARQPPGRIAPADAPQPEAPPAVESTALVPAAQVAQDDAGARREIAALYAGTVLVDWENATDNGQPVAFSIEAAQELLIQMMERIPDIWRLRVRNFADDVAHFRPPAVDPVDLGKG